VSGVAAVVATEVRGCQARPAAHDIGTVLAAALALPGMAVQAQTAPEQGEIALKHLLYKDKQPGLNRIEVRAPSLYVLAPLGTQWAVEGSYVYDAVSGATPGYHTAVSGASVMHDERLATDLKLTRYFDRASFGVGMATGLENDYHSRSVSMDASWSTDDRNRTFNIGLGYSTDKVSSTNNAMLKERKKINEFMVGITQVWTPNDIWQLNYTFNSGKGYYSDPYKAIDVRPNERQQNIVLVRWNHHFSGGGGTLRSSYRYYSDNFGIKAHTLSEEWVQPLGRWFTVTPSLRLYSQSAAKFYIDPIYDPNNIPYPPGFFDNTPKYISQDQRLSAFGGVTLGMKFAINFSKNWSADFKFEAYEQRGEWFLGDKGSPGLAPFQATFAQVGLTAKF